MTIIELMFMFIFANNLDEEDDEDEDEYEIINKLIDTKLIYNIKNVFVELHAKKIPELEEKEMKLKTRISKLNLKVAIIFT